MTTTNLDSDVRSTTAFSSFAELEACINGPRNYTPSLYPESPTHVRVRRAVLKAGYRVFPAAQVKLTGLTDTQMSHIDDYLFLSESGSDKRFVRQVRRAVTTRTTATLSLELATDFVEWLDLGKQHAIEQAGCGDAVTDEQILFAERSVERSFEALTKKMNKALRKAH